MLRYRRSFLKKTFAAGLASLHASGSSTYRESGREYWLDTLRRIADPVLNALSKRQLHATMPVEAPHASAADRRNYTHLEAIGRLLAGMAPWLESGASDTHEGELRRHYGQLAREAISAATDPASPDFMNFTHGGQPLVDAAFLAQAVLRAPAELWRKLPSSAQKHLADALRATRSIRPPFNNWLLFSATIEAALCFMGEAWDEMRVDYAVRQIAEWYKGDGAYGDGPHFHWDYYNSFVIHPMLLDVLDTVAQHSSAWEVFRAPALARARRYAAILERLIAPDGTFPPIGRSLAYRCGAFHLLSHIALHKQLPETIMPEQARCALTAVIRRTLEAPGTFDSGGWLTVGFCGHQPAIAEPYISTGSLYLCSAVFLPLGLPSSDPFWGAREIPWTQKKAWSGEDFPADHAMSS